MTHPAIFLTGCTASGKTSLGVRLAEEVGGEVISVDSMTVYCGLDIGTAKPTLCEQRGIPHHLIDVVSPQTPYSLADYLRDAAAAEQDIRRRGRVPVYVGGTPLYLRGLLYGVQESPPPNPAWRNDILANAATQPADFLHQKLAAVDPVTAARLHPNDTKRVVRALEVFHQTGVSISSGQMQSTPKRYEQIFVITWDRAALAQRIEDRVRSLLKDGWLDEARALLESGGLGETAQHAVGYAELFAVLRGEMTEDAAFVAIVTRTKRLAKHQRTWFRSFPLEQTVLLAAPTCLDAVR